MGAEGRLNRDLCKRDVRGRSEHGDGAEESEEACLGAQLHRRRDYRRVATRPRPVPSRAAASCVVAEKALWVAESLLILDAGWFVPAQLGVAVVLAQALFVGGLTELQWFALRQRPVAA